MQAVPDFFNPRFDSMGTELVQNMEILLCIGL
jgi:hypothetical protein